MYDREDLIAVLEEYGYVKSDIQRQHVAGDLLQFALSILIAKKLDELLEKLDRDSPTLTPSEKKEAEN